MGKKNKNIICFVEEIFIHLRKQPDIKLMKSGLWLMLVGNDDFDF